MTARLTATDALLACAAAQDRIEMLAARMALIDTGHGVNRDIDRATVLVGDGTAGRHLLAGVDHPTADSCGIRSRRLQERLWAELAAGDDAGAVEVSAVFRGLVVLIGVWLIATGLYVGWTSPTLSGGPLIAMPALAGLGLWLIVRARRRRAGAS
jgi:hypothetical protein